MTSSQNSAPLREVIRSAEPTPDAERLQAQLAQMSEARVDGAVDPLLPLLQLLRSLMAARTVALIPAVLGENGGIPFAGAATPELAKLAVALDSSKAQVLPATALGAGGYTLTVPIWREAQLMGWLVAQLIVPQPRDLQAFVVLLQAFAGYVLYRAQRGLVDELHSVLERTSGLLEVFRRAGTELDFEQACRVALESLCADLGCQRASLGLLRRGVIRVVAISGVGRLDSKSSSHQAIEAAMEEAVGEGQPVDWLPDSPRSDTRAAHEILGEKNGVARILTLPLPRSRGAVLLEWNEAPDPAAAPVAEAATPFVPVLFDLIERARPHPAVFAAQRLWQRASANRRRAVLVGAAALTILLASPFHYRIGADCRIAPSVKQVIAAPFDGQLRKSFVRPGDSVQAGDPLGELDNRELKLKEAELTAGRERALKERDRAMTSGARGEGADFAAAQMANFEAQSVGQELELVKRKLALLEVKAPLSGVVVSGDLRRAEGQPMPRGQVLWEVAPLDALIVEIDVPDREISRVREGMPVRVRLEAFGGGRWESALRRIHPQSEQRDGRNIFIAEADIAANRVAELRPGMHGRARIESDRRPLIWIIGHRLWDWLVTTLFW